VDPLEEGQRQARRGAVAVADQHERVAVAPSLSERVDEAVEVGERKLGKRS
jgi:hypothetical protein